MTYKVSSGMLNLCSLTPYWNTSNFSNAILVATVSVHSVVNLYTSGSEALSIPVSHNCGDIDRFVTLARDVR